MEITKNGEKRKMENMSAALTGSRISITWMQTDELGFTSSDGNIYISYEHPYMDDMDLTHKIAFRFGVFGHEILHKLFTDFNATNEIVGRHKDAEASVVMLFANLIEDPAIENLAPTAYGGELLEALTFTIRKIYEKTSPLECSKTPFTQLINALIQFGDLGYLNGSFTFPEAYQAFKNTVNEFYDMIHEPISRKRIEAAERWMENTREMWEKEAEDQKQFKKDIESLMNENGVSHINGSGGQKKIERADSKDSNKSKRQRELLSQIRSANQEDTQDIDKEMSKGTCPPSTNEDQIQKDEMTAFNKKNKRQTQENADDKLHSLSDSESEDLLNNLLQSIKSAEEMVQKDLERKAKQQLEDSIIEHETNGDTKILNEYMARSVRVNYTEYEELVQKNSHLIKLLAKNFKSILNQDCDSMERHSSGKYNIKRAMLSETAKIFDKKKAKKNLDDTAMFILVDLSGSMSGNKIQVAKESCLIIAEAFAKIKIPCYVMGFTADMGVYDVVHNHFITWKNTLDERMSLSAISSKFNNYDGFSIREADKILKKKVAEHKIMIIISDGLPNCSAYGNDREIGIKDTAAAIKQAKKTASLIGIGIGNVEANVMKQMYGGSFVCVDDVNSLPSELTKRLRRIVTNY